MARSTRAGSPSPREGQIEAALEAVLAGEHRQHVPENAISSAARSPRRTAATRPRPTARWFRRPGHTVRRGQRSQRTSARCRGFGASSSQAHRSRSVPEVPSASRKFERVSDRVLPLDVGRAAAVLEVIDAPVSRRTHPGSPGSPPTCANTDGRRADRHRDIRSRKCPSTHTWRSTPHSSPSAGGMSVNRGPVHTRAAPRYSLPSSMAEIHSQASTHG